MTSRTISIGWTAANLVLAACFVAGCRESKAPAADEAQAVADDGPAPLEAADLGSVEPAHRAGDLYLAGQPSKDDIARWARKGYHTVVNLRKPDEIDWDEGRAVRVAGMNYISIPVGSADDLTDEVFSKVRKLLGDPERRPLVLHCASSNRVGAVWMPYRALDEGVSERDAVEDAARAGLRSTDLSQKARDYIHRNQKGAK
ncbi:MAG: protein tyrosine phosphatase family protein [Planctomycetales bacterium]|nr:protein tyrosine phosphatase family protein [Planctomycetales bacterium]